MLLFLNNQNPNANPNGTIEFYQVFVDSDKVYTDEEDNAIYSLNSTNLTDLTNTKFNIDLSKYKSTNTNYKIKIIDHIISYNMENQKTNYVFTVKTNFIDPQDNQYSVPIFLHAYKSIGAKRLPNLIETEYTNTYELNFQVYEVDNQVQFIIETNLLSNKKRKYFITHDLNLIQKYSITDK